MAGSSRPRTRPVRRALLVSAVALAAALLTLSSALAARPVPRAKYEGPIDRGLSGNLSLTVARNGRSMAVDGLVVSRCSNGREYDAFVIDRRLRIRRDGSFSGRVGEDLSGARIGSMVERFLRSRR